MEEEEEDCSSPPISLSVTCLLLWPSRLWWHREGVCSPWKQEAGYLSVRHVIIKRIPGGHVNTTQCLSFRRVHTWAKDSNWSVMQAHSAKMRAGLLWRFLLSLRLCCISVLVLTLKEKHRFCLQCPEQYVAPEGYKSENEKRNTGRCGVKS